MAELKRDDVVKTETLSGAEYSEKYGNGITVQALAYAMDNDKLDFIKIGRDRYIVMTEKSRQYVPNESPKRGSSGGKITKR